MFVCIINILFIKIRHDCKSSYFNYDKYQNESLNLEISCPKAEYQTKLYVNDKHSINSISIYNNSDVIITCSQNSSKLNIIIYDKPHITFKNNCNFDKFEIYGIPTFDFPKNSSLKINKIILLNNTSTFSFKKQKFIDIDTVNRKCYSKFSIVYNNEIYQIVCDKYNYSLNINEISNYEFNVSTNAYFLINDIDENVYFYDKFEPIIQSIKLHNYARLFINFTWNKFTRFNESCNWKTEKYYDKYSFLNKYFETAVKKTKWRKVCIDETAHLYYSNIKPGRMIIIHEVASWVIVFVIIILIIGILVSFWFIARYRYNKQIAQNESEKSP